MKLAKCVTEFSGIVAVGEIQKVQRNVNLIDLVKSSPSEELVTKYDFDTTENDSFQVCNK